MQLVNHHPGTMENGLETGVTETDRDTKVQVIEGGDLVIQMDQRRFLSPAHVFTS